MVFLVLIAFELLVLLFLSRTLTRLLSRFLSIDVLSFLFLPGIIIHELSHFLIASLLFVPVGEIEFVPKRTEQGLKLGSVAIWKTDPIRRALIGVSPIIAGVLLLGAAGYFMFSNSLIVMAVLLLYLVFSVSNTMFSSSKDLEGFLEVLLVLGFFALVFYVFRIISGIRISLPPLPVESIEAATVALVSTLGVAIGLDIMIAILLKLIRR